MTAEVAKLTASDTQISLMLSTKNSHLSRTPDIGKNVPLSLRRSLLETLAINKDVLSRTVSMRAI